MKLFHFGIKSAAVALGAASLFGLSACSDDSSSNSNALDFDVIETLTEADSCRTEIAGDSIFVKDEAQVYVCKDSVWEKVNLEISSSSEKSSSSEVSSSSEKVKNVATEKDLGKCSAKLDGDAIFVENSSTYFVCAENIWVQLKEVKESSSSAPKSSSSTKSSSSIAKSSSSVSSSSEKHIVENFEDLEKCSDKNEGFAVYVESESAYYACKNSQWVKFTEYVESSSSKMSSSSERKRMIETFDEIDECTEELDGEAVYVKDEMIYFICKEDKWVKFQEYVESSSSKEKLSSSNSEIVADTAVDLGLSVKWANINIGAAEPTDYGAYYACGETKTIATAKWGEKWRVPTKDEFQELLNNCRWYWGSEKNSLGISINGYFVKSKKNNNMIFLPAAGYRGSVLSFAGSGGYYWSSTPDYYSLYFESNSYHMSEGSRCSEGQSIRPVLAE